MERANKPIVIEAIQWTGNNLYEVLSFMNCNTENEPDKISHNYQDEILVQTVYGEMRASIGDFIIRGSSGNLYPCKQKLFKKMFKAADNR